MNASLIFLSFQNRRIEQIELQQGCGVAETAPANGIDAGEDQAPFVVVVDVVAHVALDGQGLASAQDAQSGHGVKVKMTIVVVVHSLTL